MSTFASSQASVWERDEHGTVELASCKSLTLLHGVVPAVDPRCASGVDGAAACWLRRPTLPASCSTVLKLVKSGRETSHQEQTAVQMECGMRIEKHDNVNHVKRHIFILH